MGTTQENEARIGAGDEVVVPGFGGLTAARRVLALGAVPVPVDIDPRTFCIDPSAASAAMSARTAAVVACDLFGHPADLVGLERLTRAHGVRLVRAAPAQEWESGSEGRALDVAARRRNAAFLNSRLTGVVVPPVAPPDRHTYRQYVVRVPGNGRPDRDAFRNALRARGVRSHVPVKTPVHRTPGFCADLRLPEAERAAEECLALPAGASVTRRQLTRTAAACNALGGLLLEWAC
jgi:dTDP-4-amino-4,6-dideoxygalactose transaminase